MEPSQISKTYDALAQHWLEPHLDQNGIRQHKLALQFRPESGLALDVGCGCNRRFRHLLEENGYKVEGLDVSAKMLELARERCPAGTFYLADVCEWQPKQNYDFISAWDSIWHVPLNQSEKVLRKLCRALNPGGVIIWTTGGVDQAEEKQDTLWGKPLYYSVLGISRTLEVVADVGCVCRHLEFDQFPEKHLFLIAQKA